MLSKPEAVIAGTGMTQFGKMSGRTLRSLATQAVDEALSDAGITSGDVGMVFYANAAAGILHAQEMIAGQSALRRSGIGNVPFFNVENACASSSSAFFLAVMAVSAGATEVALVVGAEKLTHPDKPRSVTAIATAVDLEEDPELRSMLSASLLGWDDRAAAAVGGDGPTFNGSRFMEIYARTAESYMASSGASVHDFAEIAHKSHGNAALNPKAQYRTPVSVEKVLASRMIAPPLTLLMCSPIGDGAAALVVVSPDYAKRLGNKAVRIEAVSMATGLGLDAESSSVVAARGAYELSGFAPSDLNVVELHDAAAPAELIGYEELGLCGPGEGPKLLAGGHTYLGGRIPVNPSGGLLSRGHPIGATGCAQIVEIADQLRGRAGGRQVEGARLGLTKNSGGDLDGDAAATVVSILSA